MGDVKQPGEEERETSCRRIMRPTKDRPPSAIESYVYHAEILVAGVIFYLLGRFGVPAWVVFPIIFIFTTACVSRL